MTNVRRIFLALILVAAATSRSVQLVAARMQQRRKIWTRMPLKRYNSCTRPIPSPQRFRRRLKRCLFSLILSKRD